MAAQQFQPKGYKKLLAWQKADDLAGRVFQEVGGSDNVPRWLKEQACRSAISVPPNIAEGYSRGSIGDYQRFLDIARGSLAETEYFVDFLGKHGLIVPARHETLSALVNETGSVLYGLIRSIRAKRDAGEWVRGRQVREETEGIKSPGAG